MFLKPATVALYKALQHPEDWKCDSYTAEHKSGVVLWVGNGAFFFNGYGSEHTPSFTGLLERHVLWYFYKRMLNSSVAQQLARG